LLLTVGRAVVYEPATQTALTAAQTAPSLSAEYVVPAMQGSHWRSVVAVPSADMPLPARHVDQAELCTWPALAVNVPAALTAHARSLLDVAAAVRCVPAAQGLLIAMHALVPPSAEKVTPT
jgi:hypothetical protein